MSLRAIWNRPAEERVKLSQVGVGNALSIVGPSAALSVTGAGRKLFELVRANDLEGTVAKRLTCSYKPARIQHTVPYADPGTKDARKVLPVVEDELVDFLRENAGKPNAANWRAPTTLVEPDRDFVPVDCVCSASPPGRHRRYALLLQPSRWWIISITMLMPETQVTRG